MRPHRSYRVALLMAVSYAYARPAGAQVQYSVAEVREIVDVALEAVLPPDKELSRISVAQRRIFFDHAATLAAFGHDEPVEIAPERLQLRRVVENASPDVMEDCTEFRPMRCVGLGQGVYVSVTHPIRPTASEVVVWVHVWWTSRQSPSADERVFGAGFSSEVFLARTGQGWQYVRTGQVNVS